MLVIGLVLLVVSGIGPRERLTWVLEVFPIFIAAPVLLLTAGRFPLTRLAYWLILIHAAILMYGGHYTYAATPLGDWVKELLGHARNDYDRLGHFAQGFIPAIIVREILLRTSPLRPGRWLFFLVSSVCLAISACYEFTEWWAAVFGGEKANAFLGAQGDIWDTQWDMFLALLGSLTAQVTLSRLHDRQLATLAQPTATA